MIKSGNRVPLLRTQPSTTSDRPLPVKATLAHPSKKTGDSGDPFIYFIGNATVLIEWNGFRILTDPNFIHKGDQVHLGPGVNATRNTDPSIEIEDLPPIDLILLSHYHEDHFDKFVEAALNRSIPIISTEHAKSNLTAVANEHGGPFDNVTQLDFFDQIRVHTGSDSGKDQPKNQGSLISITAMPGSHVAPGPMALANSILQAIPPTNGWLIEFGHGSTDTSEKMECSFSTYISGDTLFVEELRQIPQKVTRQIDLMLVHLGGTTIPSPSVPMAMVTMDAKQGLQLMHLITPKITIPIHYDDYSVFASPLSDFQDAVRESKKEEQVIYLNRGDKYILGL